MRTRPRISDEVNEFGYYEIRWSEMVRGRWRSKRRSTGATTYEEAVSALSDFLKLKPVEPEAGITVAQAFDYYLRYHSLPRGNERTDRQTMRAPLVAFGDWPTSAVTNTEVDGFARERAVGRHGHCPVKSSTIRREIVALQAVINFCISKGVIKGAKVTFPKPRDGAPRDKWVTEEQQADILSRLPEASLDVRIFLRLALTYGVRRGAIMDLRFGPQVDFISNTIDFNKPGFETNRKRRPTVPMTRSIRREMEEMFKKKARGSRVCETTTPEHYRDFMTSIGYGWVTPHVLKHSAVTLMLRAGVQPMDVAKLTATDLRTIYKVYRHHTVEELTAIAESRGV